ncbi:MAG: hypothetical protein HKN79_09385 [Flavobacteriales bacterium]|nr:hypothetical protein [Flavobacteriales bacterium]
MNKEQAFESIQTLRERVDRYLSKLSDGDCTLHEMDALLADLRELEERTVIIRYKAMETLTTRPEAVEEQEGHEEAQEAREPEPAMLSEAEEENDQAGNQISLIDSIEELSRDVSINENHSEHQQVTLAEKLEVSNIDSISKALSINLKVGLVDQIFGGDDEAFKRTIEHMDQAEDLDAAWQVIAQSGAKGYAEDHPLIVDLKELTERKYR